MAVYIRRVRMVHSYWLEWYWHDDGEYLVGDSDGCHGAVQLSCTRSCLKIQNKYVSTVKSSHRVLISQISHLLKNSQYLCIYGEKLPSRAHFTNFPLP